MGDKMIAACGIDCAACDAFIATQAGDESKIAEIAEQWSKQFGADIPASAAWCDGCIPGGERACGHMGECKIRACVLGRGFENCAPCADFDDCDNLKTFFAYPGTEAAKATLESLRA